MGKIESSPEDVGGMHAAEGILASRGGMMSHAVAVARGWGKPYVRGCSTLAIDANSKLVRVRTTSGTGVVLRDDDYIGFFCVNRTAGEAIKARNCRRLP
ncbi:hypothetical protein PR002_g32546 [Phytophthora rubi]|uniref:PEP-utilising enzyme mobile domain-containing protein n=1 Tax=Phytophthora rubi TaxID=129364 RepID=A0A6A3G311_9STRA|nr:hypothetical protein PR002_g32546 [Phytophthora rubi]